MKKNLSMLMLAAFALASCDDDCDHATGPIICPEVEGLTYEFLSAGTGSWYEEAENEEFRPTISGRYYDKYCNLFRASESEGTYELMDRGFRMTQTYKFMGQTQFADWKVSDIKELSFVISSNQVGGHTYEKVVESYTLDAGQTQYITFTKDYPSYNVTSFSSTNEHIASVSAEGMITANGEKGTAYVKIAHNQGSSWVKVVVGDNYADLWYDYSVLLGYNFTQLTNLLGNPDVTSEENNCYTYITELHDVLDYFNVFINPSTQKVEQIDMHTKEGVPSLTITAYMDAHYYFYTETSDFRFYTTSAEVNESRALFGYNKDAHSISIVEAEGFFDLWKDFTPLFGTTAASIQTEMKGNGFTYLMSDYSYSTDGSDYYEITDNLFATMVGFVFNKDKKMCEYWVYMDTSGDAATVYGFLSQKYEYAANESSDGNYIFYNRDGSVRITFSLKGYVIYQKVDMVGPTKPAGLWPDYSTALGKSHDEIVNEYGSPVMDDDSGIWYITSSEYIQYLMFRADAATGKIKFVVLRLDDAVETQTITDYLGSLYTVFANGTAADGSQYAWTNGPSVAESTFGVVYYPDDKQVIYQSLNVSNSAPRQNLFNITDESKCVSIPAAIATTPFVKQRNSMSMKLNDNNWVSPLLKNISVIK